MTHAELFAEAGLDDLCGLDGVSGPHHGMRGATDPSARLLDGLDRSRLVIDDEVLAAHRPTLLKALYAENDADLFCREIDRRVATGRLTLSPAFREFERLWRRDELDHTVGFARLLAVLYREDETTVLDDLRRRQADFARLEPILTDEFSICLLLAYDELATTLSYAEDTKQFYPRFGDERLTRWMRRLAGDEARHYGNLIRVLRTSHAADLPRAVGVLDAIHRLDLDRPEYRGTFVLDHDDPAVFPAATLDDCRRRVLKNLGVTAERHVAARVNGRSVRVVDPALFYSAPATEDRHGLGLYCRAALDPGDVWWANDLTDRRFVARVIPWAEYLSLSDEERGEAERLCFVDPDARALVVCAEPFCRVNHSGRRANSACDADGNSVITRAVPAGEEVTQAYEYEAVVSLVWKFPAFRAALPPADLRDERVLFTRAGDHPAAARFLGTL